MRKALLPSWGEIAFWMVLLCCDHFLGGNSWWQAFKFIAPYFLASRAVEVTSFCAKTRWPRFFESRGWLLVQRAFWSIMVSAIVGYWLVFGGVAEQFLAFRPDWRGALFVLAFGAILVLLWPFYRLFERYLFKS